MAISREKLVRFDWAVKRLLRHRSDHTVLNGFLSTLLGREIHITEILEGESNREYEENKSNRVDVLAKEADGSKIIIEIQNETESSYLHRILFGTSKLISEYLEKGQNYDEIKKIYSVNIVYFNIDDGDDFVYYGTTDFRGLHSNKPLKLPDYIKGRYHIEKASDIFPEYYILKANDFNKLATTPLEEWMHFLAHSELPEKITAPGLKEAGEQLREAALSPEQRADYFYYLDGLKSIAAAIDTAGYRGRMEGLAEGREAGLAEGAKKEKFDIARNALSMGLSPEDIAKLTGLSFEQISTIQTSIDS